MSLQNINFVFWYFDVIIPRSSRAELYPAITICAARGSGGMEIEMKGIITDIQRFSLNDGPGIRTTVFFKGCNMACLWCHNPETISSKSEIIYYSNNCINCFKCLELCPTRALKQIENKLIFVRERCNNCGECAKICFPGALVLPGKEMELGEVMDEVMQDTLYYQNSGGGITLSGGEVFLQPEFAYRILEKCKENNIHTAIETNLYAPWEKISKLLEVTDLVMFDIKMINSKEHEKWTGADNERILENIKLLSAANISMIARTPVIPGVNDTPERIGQIAAFISELKGNLLYYELLNFNPLGEFKYKGLDRKNNFAEERPLSEKKIGELADTAGRYGVSVKIG